MVSSVPTPPRFEKLDVIFLAFLCFAFIAEALRASVNTP